MEVKMLELKGIKKDYHTGISDVWALKGIDLRFRDCEFVSVLGQRSEEHTSELQSLS